ncbi:MAG TPA: hypothetical protein VMX97_14185 [Hyphomicrobiaceae bacterium]|nr:hypothetical protein [Hyphomicrobiaceae bacterium]
MTDNVRQGQSQSDILHESGSLVTLDVVSRRFIAAGLPRSTRTLQRYCANGTLECVKEATDTGDTYFVAARSIEMAITALHQLHDAKKDLRHGATERAVSHAVAQEFPPSIDLDPVGPSPTPPDDGAHQDLERPRAPGPDVSRHVAQLEQRLDEKDDEIAFLREELIDRRGQIKDMKGIIDGQNQLLETIQTNVAPIFQALASTVKRDRIKLEGAEEGSAQDARNNLEPSDGERFL